MKYLIINIFRNHLLKNIKNKLNWKYISEFQKLSETFIEKYKDKLILQEIIKFQKLNKSLIEKYKNEIKRIKRKNRI